MSSTAQALIGRIEGDVPPSPDTIVQVALLFLYAQRGTVVRSGWKQPRRTCTTNKVTRILRAKCGHAADYNSTRLSRRLTAFAM